MILVVPIRARLDVVLKIAVIEMVLYYSLENLFSVPLLRLYSVFRWSCSKPFTVLFGR